VSELKLKTNNCFNLMFFHVCAMVIDYDWTSPVFRAKNYSRCAGLRQIQALSVHVCADPFLLVSPYVCFNTKI
jgi:hypothetical protein